MLPLRLVSPLLNIRNFVNSAMNAKTPHGNSEGVNFRKSFVNFLGGLAFLADFVLHRKPCTSSMAYAWGWTVKGE